MQWSRLGLAIIAPLVLSCSGDGSSSDSATSDTTSTTSDTGSGSSTGGSPIICKPGDKQCNGDGTIETCGPSGTDWIPELCDTHQTCMACAANDENCTEGAQCIGPCELGEEIPSSAGCSFIVSRLYHNTEEHPDAVLLGNPSLTETATVQEFFIPVGTRDEEPVGEPFMLGPGEDAEFLMPEPFDDSFTSAFRTGGLHRFRSNLPIIAYLQSPILTKESNDGSMLLPETALRQDYVALSWSPKDAMHAWLGSGEPSYFRVIALHDDTTVEWTPPNATAGPGLPIKFVEAGQTGSIKMNRFDTMRVAASNMTPNIEDRDVSGTVIRADKPIWVGGGVFCAFVDPPMGNATCDHMQEVMIPLELWGTRYVAAHSPVRGTEQHFWRVFAAADNVTITTDPPQPGTPFTLAKRGDFEELVVPTGTSFIFDGDKPFMPVQYLDNKDNAGGKGDPAMYQFVPVEQFLSSYVFVTGKNYPVNYVQIIRQQGNADVKVDDMVVTGYVPVGNYEVAELVIIEGPHKANSADPFGIVQLGYSDDDENKNWSSYAFPGGMKVEEIFVP